MIKKITPILAFSLIFNVLAAQTAERRAGEIIIHLASDYPVSLFLTELNRTSEKGFFLKETIASDWNMHLISFDPKVSDPEEVLDKIGRKAGVVAAQFNHRSEERFTTPNDKDWWRQWSLELIQAPVTWDHFTGGVTPKGDTIVLAILEKGIHREHPDLINNLWINRLEIPGNNIDDDGNGYVDDFWGWNPRFLDDSCTPAHHGTGVCGIVGAEGNNDIGISGVNWKTQLMTFCNVEYESEIIAAYNYVAKMRKLYNQTGGQKGAFVVATNASFGLDKQFAKDHPLWCAVYDSLGTVGVLSIGATANKDVDVDTQGDMPTSCPSEFLITVTNVDKRDEKVAGAGYGVKSIDLGSPGSDTYTTSINDNYANLGGTSAATPHVTGVVGLLYSYDCQGLAADALTAPSTCARRFRDIILESVKPNETLEGITTTGGRVDLSEALDVVVPLCGNRPGELAIAIQPNPTYGGTVEVRYDAPDYEVYNFRVYNALGQLVIEQVFKPQGFSLKQLDFESDLLPRGFYVAVVGRGKTVVSQKFLKL